MAQVALDEPGVHAGFEQMGSVRMSQGMDGDAHVGDPGALFGFAEGALDTGASHGGGRRGTLGVIPPRGRQQPGGGRWVFQWVRSRASVSTGRGT